MKFNIKDNNKWLTYILYTCIFVISAYVVVYPFLSTGRTFIWIKDGLDQHYRALLYYSQWIKEIANNFFVNHTFNIPAYAISVGYGGDILHTFHYYAIGDPLNVIAWFWPLETMYNCYSLLILVRMYLSGLAFIMYCRYMKKDNMYPILFGAIAYAFCGYTLDLGFWHPYFANPLIYMPLLFLGIEKIFKEKKIILFIEMVAISAISNFYFFYLLVVAVIFYTLIRGYFATNKNIKEYIQRVFLIGIYGVLGTAQAMVMLLPIVMILFNDTRSSIVPVYHLFYKLHDYKRLLQGITKIVTTDYYAIPGYTLLMVCTTLYMFFGKENKKKNTEWKIMFLIFALGLIFPFFGSFMNGFSYVTNRFIWILDFIISYIVVLEWDRLIELKKKNALILGGVAVAYLLLLKVTSIELETTAKYNIAVLLIMALLAYVVDTRNFQNKKFNKIYPAMISLAGITLMIFNGVFYFHPKYENYAIRSARKDYMNTDYLIDESKEVLAVEDNTNYYRYTGKNLKQNASVQSGISSTQFFWSLSDGIENEFFNEMENSGVHNLFSYSNLDDRTILNTLACVKYYTTGREADDSYLPYGYELVKRDNYDVYENKYALPLGYTYDNAISKSDADSYSALEKEEIMLSNVIIDGADINNANVNLLQKEIPYTIECKENVIKTDSGYVALEENAEIVLRFDKVPDSETYVEFKDIYFTEKISSQYVAKQDFRDNKELELVSVLGYNSEHGDVYKYMGVFTPIAIYNTDRHNYLLNMTYSEEGIDYVKIAFPKVGTYDIGDINVIALPMTDYVSKVEKLKEETLQNINLNCSSLGATNTITGNIKVSGDKYLLIALPYSKGWSAYVDGNKTEIKKANIMYMAISLTEGDHEITLKYETPGLALGFLISILGIVTTIFVYFIINKKVRG